MVNLEENFKKKPYICPIMVVERIDFSDIIVTSSSDAGGPAEEGDPDQYNEW